MACDTFRFNPLLITESVILEFLFGDELESSTTLAGTPTVAVTVASGTDATPSTIIGVVTLQGNSVLVQIDARNATFTSRSCDYKMCVTSGTSDPLVTLSRLAILPIIKC